jgi:hypothetical protein
VSRVCFRFIFCPTFDFGKSLRYSDESMTWKNITLEYSYDSYRVVMRCSKDANYSQPSETGWWCDDEDVKKQPSVSMLLSNSATRTPSRLPDGLELFDWFETTGSVLIVVLLVHGLLDATDGFLAVEFGGGHWLAFWNASWFAEAGAANASALLSSPSMRTFLNCPFRSHSASLVSAI